MFKVSELYYKISAKLKGFIAGGCGRRLAAGPHFSEALSALPREFWNVTKTQGFLQSKTLQTVRAIATATLVALACQNSRSVRWTLPSHCSARRGNNRPTSALLAGEVSCLELVFSEENIHLDQQKPVIETQLLV